MSDSSLRIALRKSNPIPNPDDDVYEAEIKMGKSYLHAMTWGVSYGLEVSIRWSRISHKKRKRLQKARLELLANSRLLVDQTETCIRKLAAAMTGVTVQAILTSISVHHAVGLSINGVEVLWQFRQLRKLNKTGALACIPYSNITQQVVLGIILKLIFQCLFLGQDDFIGLIDKVSGLVSDSNIGHMIMQVKFMNFSGFERIPEAIKASHDKLLANPIGGFLQKLIEEPTTQMKTHLGLPEDWEQHEHEDTSSHSARKNIAAIGGVTASADVIAARLIEEPVHKAIEKSKHQR